LKLGVDKIEEKDFKPLSKEESSVWDSDHPTPPSDEAAELKVVQGFDKDDQAQLAKLAPKDSASLAEYRRVLGGAWDILIGRGMPPKDAITTEHVGDAPGQGFATYLNVVQYKKMGEELPTAFLLPNGWNKQVVIWLTDDGKAGLFQNNATPTPAVQTLVNAGYAVAGVDLLYQGEFLSPGTELFRTRRVYNPREFLGYTAGYNHPFFSQRVHDVLTMLSFVRDHETKPAAVYLAGFGESGLYAAAAAAQAGSLVKKLAVGTNGYRFASITDVRDPMLLPGAVKYGDVPGLLSLSAPQPLWVAGEKAASLGIASQAYAAAGQPKALEIYDGSSDAAPAAAAKWIAAK
jgi:hypothetical protein